ncbi:MAG: Crp/Fnr family transcriptional regulator [Reyranella sp.]|nr:Crp/Fnr family transcriptional regulator [Reyranella sp.]
MTVDLLRHPDGERRPLDEASDSCGHRGEGAPRRGARARDTVPLMTPQDLFRLHPFLGALTESESRELLAHAVRRRVSAGHVVFRKDDPGDGLYGVLGGRIVVTVESAAGKELILNMFGPGEFFGEIALLDGKGRTATAIAREPSELLFLSRAVFQPFLAQRPDATMRIIALLCSRLRRTTDLVEDSAFLGVATRLAKQLVVLMDRYGRPEVVKAGGVDSAAPTLHISQEELARTLGVSREIVSRQLAIWREAGIVELGRSRLTVLDLPALYGIIAGG